MSIFTEFLKNIIEMFYSITGDYGVAIVLITILIRSLLLPMDINQWHQMKKQKEISQKVEAIKNKYKNDKKQMEIELQKFYQGNGTGMGSCLLSVMQFPIMIGLYNAIRLISATACATVLLPWVSSLLVRDSMFIMPVATLIVQILPQTYPYLKLFRTLKLHKQPVSSIIVMLSVNSLYLFMIPSGVGLYCFTSGLFQMLEQFIFNLIAVQKIKIQEA